MIKVFLMGAFAAFEAWFLWTLNTYLEASAGAGWIGTVVWWWALVETVFAAVCGVVFLFGIVTAGLD